MTYGNTPKDNANTPLGSVYVPNTTGSDLTALEGIAINTDGNGQKSSGARLGLLDGDDVTQGLKADPAVVGDTSGTLSAKLRGLNKMINDMWDSVNHRLHVVIDNAVALGQAASSASSPVVIASDQSTVPVKNGTLQIAGAGTGTVNANGTDLFAWTDVSDYRYFSLQLTGTFVLTLTIQGSNDGVNPSTIITQQIGSGAANFTTASAVGIYEAPLKTKWFRARVTAFTSNTSLVGTLQLFTIPPPTAAVNVVEVGTWNVGLNPIDTTLVTAAAYTATQTSADQLNTSGRGIRVVLDVTTAGTGSVTLTIQFKDVASGKYVAVLTGAAVTTVSTNVYIIYPGVTPVANAVVADILSHTWRTIVTANNSNSITYSLGSSTLL